MNDLTYLQTYFLDQHQLCAATQISPEKLEELINDELIPDASYVMKSCHVITSPLDDKTKITETKKYFPKSTINLIKANLGRKAADFKAEMKSCYIQTVLENDKHHLICQDKAELDSIFENQWQYYLAGIYGICTLHANAEEIAKKGIAVEELIQFIENKQMLSDEEKQQQLQYLNNFYNEVSSIFAPYQRENSSRGKYIDKQLREHNLLHLIQNYDH